MNMPFISAAQKGSKGFKVKIYVIFHEYIYNELYANLKWHRDNLIFIGVKKRISKIRQWVNNYHIIYEQDLKNYNSELNGKAYKETTAICHTYINRLYEGLDYVGFAQYDMAIGDDVFETIYQHRQENPDIDYIFYAEKCPIACSNGLIWKLDRPVPPIAELMINSYNKHFHTNHAINEIINNPRIAENFIMCSTFVIPVKIFEKIMGWISDLIYEASFLVEKMPKEYPVAHVFERAYGLALSLELMNEKTELIQVPITHNHEYNLREIDRLRIKIEPYLIKITTQAMRRGIKKVYRIIKKGLEGIVRFNK